ncbi:MAG: YkgJ family cysteine cluster protein [Lentisphaeria bacterium]
METPQRTFYCHACGACCRWPGIVRVNKQEITAIAEFLQIPEDHFREQYTIVSPDRKTLIFTEREDGACIFLSADNLCRIHPVKPLQCKTFPDGWTVPPEFRERCQGEYR